ncbi:MULTISPECIES: NlpC/P60 family peptidoglycan endopeptidase RipA [Mycolicibacterium]|uniref:Cell wall-associated hydrolase, invasion-associated protein n=3 Tax=Mycolicibacterium gilvum TaxID=1804 RepID=E6TBH9_MYCSR|nr:MULTISPECIES: NlpC/P60 family peptidoglycan endopeptidase RipA [Mycolicibacterium]ABP46137.1 NLP/P60 protein [Mycolicibacterium gilvum PYR-GCK]ADT99627.1 cell wall-associated hydrolase, invasion-associated protein [Mycolicibacterium gilvum Spyr1]MBV5246398.1 NlpC/P60 family peptidoglycan endopeptidase RipA [Mycolicibacterium sp. PAM1]MCV7054556.1 NlpC/P60 family peptidoglycan endopeptidase RipA [Mycolicibacterium gilvum]STZ43431.1 NLP/P60 protein [Mycolicibacterium gilvum]
MRRTPGGASASRLCAASLAFGMVLTVPNLAPHLALAQPAQADGIARLVTDVANVNQQLQDLGAQIQMQQESVNKAILDVQTARDDAAAAQLDVDASAQRVKDANAAIAAAQARFDKFAAAMYVRGPSSSYLTASDPTDILHTAAAGQSLSISSQKVMADLQRARTEQVNKESAARLAKQKADDAVKAAETSQQDAVSALTKAQETFKAQQTELDRLTAERAQAQARLQQARSLAAPSSPAPSSPAPAAAPTGAATGAGAPAPGGSGSSWDVDPATGNRETAWDMTLPQIPSAFVSGDPIQIINAVLKIITTSVEITQNLGRKFLQSIGLLPTPTGITNGAIPALHGRNATEYVIKRGMSQMGVPYSWGGGNAAGPSRGIDSGAGTVGFDCSGLMLYMFAGVGIKLDHYSGSQYNAGRKVPSSQMRRGDMIFYGPNASQHVAMYLGDGQMLEAPYTGSVVKISPVRTSGMTPYVTRMIEW